MEKEKERRTVNSADKWVTPLLLNRVRAPFLPFFHCRSHLGHVCFLFLKGSTYEDDDPFSSTTDDDVFSFSSLMVFLFLLFFFFFVVFTSSARKSPSEERLIIKNEFEVKSSCWNEMTPLRKCTRGVP